MQRKIIQDIKPGKKKSIRDIPLPQHRQRSNNIKEEIIQESKPPEPPEDNNRNNNSSKGYSKWLIWSLAVVAVLIVVFTISSLFKGADVSLVPKQKTIGLDDVLTAHAEAEAGLKYETVKTSKTLEKTVSATGEEYVEQKSSGIITIYNTHDENTQRLIKNTRFESPDGLIYRIAESIVVPGMNAEEPGTIDVTVYADEPGENYNIGEVEFTIPGFEGTERFETFYAKSKTPMTGGFVGNRKIVSEEDKQKAVEELRSQLRKDLKKDLISQTPSDFVIFEDGLFYSFESLSQKDSGDSSSVILREKGTVEGIIFDKISFSEYAAERYMDVPENIDLMIENMDQIDFSLNDKENISLSGNDPVNFSVSGKAELVWVINKEEIKSSLVGEKRDKLTSILISHPEIEKADAVIRPFWKRSFPEDEDDINISIVSEIN